MMRLGTAILLTAALGLAALLLVKPDSDVAKVLGPGGQIGAGLDSPMGRSMVIAVVGADRDARTAAAKAFIAELRDDPLVGRVGNDPAYPADLLDWLWDHRLLLAPPSEGAVSADSMAEELGAAVESFDDFAQASLAPRYLLDPTGSFRTIITGVQSATPNLPTHNGIFQARDNSAALIFAVLHDAPFDVAVQSALNDRIHSFAETSGHTALIVGPRPISAQISTRISHRATLSAGIATALLLVWLVWLTRSVAGLLRILLPIALGGAAAAALVQAIFGSVHVLALGFGGALMGLAIDYPIHLISHGDTRENRQIALRWILLGAVTTAIAFVALSIAGIPALTQIGVFVATGLCVAAAGCLWLGNSFTAATMRPAGWHPPVLRIPAPLIILTGVALLSGLILWARPTGDAPSLVQIPDTVKTDIARMAEMQEPPSGQLQIRVTGTDLKSVLQDQARLKSLLNAAQAEGILTRSQMVLDLVRYTEATPPTPNNVARHLPTALAHAGLAPDFAAQINDAYAAAVKTAQQPKPIPPELLEASGLSTLLWPSGDRLTSTVYLWDVADPGALQTMVEQMSAPNIRLIDQQARVFTHLSTLTDTVLKSLGIGAILALVFLALFRRDAPMIAIATAAATIVTALLINLATGPLGIFQIVALVLVTGIGIDYGLFLRNDTGERAFQVAASSVTRCAVTTLIAFVTMAFSGVTVLENIGLTVSVGVAAMLAAHLIQAPTRGGT